MTIVLDIIDGARWREVNGRVAEITRVALLSDLTPGTTDDVLRTALDDEGLPQPGAAHPNENECLLVERVPRPLEPGIVSIDLVYRLPSSGGFNIPPNFPTTIRGGSSTQQIETAVDRNGAQITVEFEGREQGGVIAPLVAVEHLSLGETLQSADPTLVSRPWTNAVNSGPFYFDQSALARTWRIAEVSYELVNADTVPFPTWTFGYELEKRPIVVVGIVGGWDPQVVYIDPEENRPPPDLLAGVGYKTIPWHFEGDFSILFGV
jgi:hypothetical protein